MSSLSVMGVGKVGGEVAFLASAMGLVDELNIYDTDSPLLHAQALDLKHTGLDVNLSTDQADLTNGDIFLFTAGFPRTPDIKTRADLLEANKPVSDMAAEHLKNYDGILITVTNPMDANNYYLWKKSGLPRERCIGSGGQLDSARYRCFMDEHGISGEAWVIGEHGEHQVPLFSKLPFEVPFENRDEILSQMKSASMQVIKGKGGTVFGPAQNITDLIRAVLNDERKIIPCSCVLKGEYGVKDCSIGVPAMIGRAGISKISEWELDEWEEKKFQESAAFLTNLCRRTDEK